MVIDSKTGASHQPHGCICYCSTNSQRDFQLLGHDGFADGSSQQMHIREHEPLLGAGLRTSQRATDAFCSLSQWGPSAWISSSLSKKLPRWEEHKGNWEQAPHLYPKREVEMLFLSISQIHSCVIWKQSDTLFPSSPLSPSIALTSLLLQPFLHTICTESSFCS